MSLLRAGALVSGLTLAGRALGYGRTAVVAAVLGAGGTADAFVVALRLGGDAFVSALAALAALAVVAAAALGMPVLVRLAAPGLAGDADGFDLAVALARVMLPCLVLGGPALVLCAMLNGAGRFAAAASMALLFNLSALAGLFALGPMLGSPAHGLAAGVAAAGVVQLAVLAPACRRAGLGLRLHLPRCGPEERALFGRTAPAAVSAGALQAVLLVDLGSATLLAAGAASHLDYAARVSGLVAALVGGAAATARAMAAYAAGLPAWVAEALLAAVLLARGERPGGVAGGRGAGRRVGCRGARGGTGGAGRGRAGRVRAGGGGDRGAAPARTGGGVAAAMSREAVGRDA